MGAKVRLKKARDSREKITVDGIVYYVDELVRIKRLLSHPGDVRAHKLARNLIVKVAKDQGKRAA